MPTGQYPFIDIAVHDKVRNRFASGDAVVVLSETLDDILWVNGAGASLFGHAGLYEFMDEGLNRSATSFRQIEAAARNIRNVASATTQTFAMRTGSGFRRPVLSATMECIVLSDGNQALLVAVDNSEPVKTLQKRAACILDGFEETDTHAAVLDATGAIVDATSSFDRLQMDPAERARIVGNVSRPAVRLAKRPIRTALGHLPAAIARISDDPPLHLLFAIEMSIGNLDPLPDGSDLELDTEADLETDKGAAEQQETTTAELTQPDASAVLKPLPQSLAEQKPSVLNMVSEDIAEAAPFETDMAEPIDSGSASTPEIIADDPETPADEENDEPQPVVPVEETIVAVSETSGPQPVYPLIAEADGFLFNPDRRPVRFVWKIDADGVFHEISPEFARAVGPNSADVEGRKFTDVADVFNIDEDHTITELLRKRDTWSGKTVLWPVQGTDLRVPVDLAALPTYSRERIFDGFRGFGIVRSADAVNDPERIGLALVNNPRHGEETQRAGAGVDPVTLQEPGLAAESETSAKAETSTQPVKSAEPLLPTEPVQAVDVSPESEGDDENVLPLPSPTDADKPLLTTVSADKKADDAGADVPANDTPALEISDSPGRRRADKVIQLEERRSKTRDGLSNTEKLAFREIAERLGKARSEAGNEPLRPFGKRQPPAVPTTQHNDNAVPDEPTAPKIDDQTTDKSAPVLPIEDKQTALEPEKKPALDKPDLQAANTSASDRPANGVTPTLLEQLPTPIVVHDGTTIFYLNEEFRLLTGFLTRKELNEAGGVSVLFADDEAAQDMEKPETSGELVLRCADARTICVRAKLRSISWEDGHALMLALTPSKRIEAVGETDDEVPEPATPAEQPETDVAETSKISALQVEVDELRSILETATDGVVLIGEDGIIRSMNRSASGLFDFDENETRGRPFAMLFAHESQRAVKDYLSGLSGNGVASVLNDGREVIGREASGGFLPLFMTIGHLSGSNGYCAVMRDITQWKRAEEELRAAKREAETASSHKSDFLARVSHEIRTPLNAIIGFSELMAGERFGPIGSPRYLEYAHDIGRSGKLVLDIVNDLLDISKIEAGEQEMDFGAVSLNEALLETVSILQPQANSQRVIVRTSLSSSVPDVVADLRSVKQIAINILSNAIRFTPAGGQIVVSTAYEQDGNVSLRIRDTGVGMTRHQLEQAMKPFKQVTGFQRQRGDGTGLGLPLAKAMTEANRAQFSMNSQPGQGTLVEIIFPSQRVLAQ